MKPKNNPLKLILCLLICIGGGWISGLFSNQSTEQWYPTLIKSPLTPPNFVFPIAWTILYFMMGIALYLVWSAPEKIKKIPLLLFAIQLFFNFIWSFIFFYLQKPGLALFDIALLWISLLGTIFAFFRISKLASYLLIPYLAWVSFAFYLNLFIWMKN